MPSGQLVLLACPHAGQAVGFVSSPSCRAGTYFRYAAKVSKDAPNEKKGNKVALGKPFQAVSLFPLETLFSSADRGPPPHGKRAVSYVCESVKAVPAAPGTAR